MDVTKNRTRKIGLFLQCWCWGYCAAENEDAVI